MAVIGGMIILIGIMLTHIQPGMIKTKGKKQSFKLKKLSRESSVREQHNYE
jgi:hypothetical protein